MSSAGGDAARLISHAGIVMDPWQQLVLDVAMSLRADQTWAAKTVDVLCSRQNGKNVIVEARELYGAMILGEQVTHTAHLFPTARKSFKRIKDLLRAHPDLGDELVQKYESPASGYSFEFRSGGLIEFIARSTSSGRGFTGDLLILDEVQDLSDGALGALIPSLSATSIEGDPQLWFLGSAPGPTSEVWQRRRKAGRNGGAPTSAYFEFSADPDSDLDDPEAWAQANPGLGRRISEEFIRDTERSSMSPEMFARERLSISPDLAEGTGLIDLDDWAACRNEKSGLPKEVFGFALDVSPSRTWAAFATAGQAGEGGTHVEVVDHLSGTDWLVPRAVELQQRWGGVIAVAAGSPAASLIPDLEQANVKVLEVSTADHAKACGRIFDEISEHKLRHLGQPELDLAVANATRTFSGDSWFWARRASSVDITPLVTVTLAKWAFEHAPRDAGGFVDLADFEEE